MFLFILINKFIYITIAGPENKDRWHYPQYCTKECCGP